MNGNTDNGRRPDLYERTHTTNQLLSEFDELCEKKMEIFCAGRVMSKRDMGKTIFFHIQDQFGQIQCMARLNDLTEEVFRTVKSEMKMGDIVGVGGTVFATRTGEKTIHLSD